MRKAVTFAAMFIVAAVVGFLALGLLGPRSHDGQAPAGPSASPSISGEPSVVVVPKLIGLSVSRARTKLQAAGLGVAVTGTGSHVGRTNPPGGTTVPTGVTIELITRP